MQDHPLLISSLLEHAEREHGAATMVSRHSDGEIVRQSYAQFAHRARRLAGILRTLGVAAGDVLASLAWNTDRHMEVYYAVSGLGAVCHTLNPRLFEPEITFSMNDAGDSVLFVDLDLADIAERCAPEARALRAVVVLCREDQLPALNLPEGLALYAYETLLEAAQGLSAWPVLDERDAAMLCYTSGTTGRPKGVLYSHRAILLHTYGICAADGFGCRAVDTVLPAVPMFHVMAWGFPYAAMATGFSLALPGNKLDGAALHRMIQQEGVTIASGVPIVWLALAVTWRRPGPASASWSGSSTAAPPCRKPSSRPFAPDMGFESSTG